MATQKCPKCKSREIRQGYRPTPLLLKFVGFYNLLCDNCNWEFRGFAIPGTVPRKTKRKKNAMAPAGQQTTAAAAVRVPESAEGLDVAKKSEFRIDPVMAFARSNVELNTVPARQKLKHKRKVRVKLH